MSRIKSKVGQHKHRWQVIDREMADALGIVGSLGNGPAIPFVCECGARTAVMAK